MSDPADRPPVDLHRPQGSQVGDGNVQQNFFSGSHVAWTAGTIAAVVVGALLTVLTIHLLAPEPGRTGPSQSAAGQVAPAVTDSPGAASAPAPLTVAVADRTSPCGPGWLIGEVGPGALPPATVGYDDEYRQWARENNAVAVGTDRVELAIQGRSEAQVTLLGMRAKVIKRNPPMRGTAYGLQCGGEGVYRWMSVNLDAPRPTAVSRIEDSIEPDDAAPQRRGPIRFPYTVALNDTELFLVDGSTEKCLCEWIIEVDWTSQGRSGVMVVDDNGRPFRTTAAIAVVRSCAKRQFEAIDPAVDCRPGTAR